jgi:mono/diheme cytochrome c family protein
MNKCPVCLGCWRRGAAGRVRSRRHHPATVRLDSGNAQLLATGQAVYGKHCASCHGAQLQGQPNWRERDASGRLPAPPHDASGHTWHHSDEVLFNITKYGVAKAANLKDYQSAMPVYEGVLTDAEIIAVLSWIKSRWPVGRARQAGSRVNAAAERNKARLAAALAGMGARSVPSPTSWRAPASQGLVAGTRGWMRAWTTAVWSA